jgi:hypothetical protein
MATDPRISDKELAAINAAAVTREYRVQPHIGASGNQGSKSAQLSCLYRLPYCFSDQWVSTRANQDCI